MLESSFTNTTSIFFCIAKTFILSTTISRMATMSPSHHMGLPTADCILEISSNWFTSVSSCWPCRSTMLSCCFTWGDSTFCMRFSEMPLMTVSGVRNSCVILVKKSLLVFSIFACSFCECFLCLRA